MSSQLQSVLAQVDGTAAGLAASWQGQAGSAAQAAYARFQDAANKQNQVANEIKNSINSAGLSYPSGDDGSAPLSQGLSGGMNSAPVLSATQPGALTSARGASTYEYAGAQSGVGAITASIPTVQQLLDEGDQALLKLAALWGGTGTSAFKQVQQQWDTSAAALMTALRDLANTATQAEESMPNADGEVSGLLYES
jgi:early secretory antigenic target protein ESAT-6